ncbi:hypothetical protein ACN6LL_006542, partial [Streptomyces violaceoruber]
MPQRPPGHGVADAAASAGSGARAVPDVLAGVTELPADCGAAVRVLGHTSRAVQTAMHAAWDRTRVSLLGA